MSSAQLAMIRKALTPKSQVLLDDSVGGAVGVRSDELHDSTHHSDTSSTVDSDDESEEDSDEEDSYSDSESESEEEDIEMLEEITAEIMRFTSEKSSAPASSHLRNTSPQWAQGVHCSMTKIQPWSDSASLTVVRQDDSGIPDSSPQTLLRHTAHTTEPPRQKAMPCDKYDDCSPTHCLLKMVGELGGPEDLFVPTKYVEDYFVKHSPEQVAAYTADFVRALRRNDLEEVRRMHQDEGHILQASNPFGETVIHIACRRGAFEIVKYMVEEGGVSIRVRDDYGRTPLHDCCWTAEPNVELMTYLVKLEPDMLFMTDAKGFTPLEYARMKHRSAWNKFLEDIRTVVACKCQAKRLKCSV